MPEQQYPTFYNIDPLIRVGSNRLVPIFNFDIPRQMFVSGILFLFPALIATSFMVALVGIYGAFAFPAVEAAGIWLLHSRSRRGAQLLQWQTMLDKKVNRNNVFMVAGEEIDFMALDIRETIPSCVPPPARNAL